VAVHGAQHGKTLRSHWQAVRAQRGERVEEHAATVPEIWTESKSLKTLGIAWVSRCWGARQFGGVRRDEDRFQLLRGGKTSIAHPSCNFNSGDLTLTRSQALIGHLPSQTSSAT
jgi:hypothetical protein